MLMINKKYNFRIKQMRYFIALIFCLVVVISEGGSTKSYSGGSGSTKSYSGGSGSTKSYSGGSGSTKSYSGGSGSTKSYSGGSGSTKPNSSSTLSNAAKIQESKQKFEASKIPKYTNTTSSTKTTTSMTGSVSSTKPIEVKKYVTNDRYVTYDSRSSSFYRGYQPTYYNDSFSPFLMGYLFSSAINSNDRAYWVYHHIDQMDQERYREMLDKDSELSTRIQNLEKQGVKKDPNYTLSQMKDNPDLQYKKDTIRPKTNRFNIGIYFFIFVLIVGFLYLFFVVCTNSWWPKTVKL